MNNISVTICYEIPVTNYDQKMIFQTAWLLTSCRRGRT